MIINTVQENGFKPCLISFHPSPLRLCQSISMQVNCSSSLVKWEWFPWQQIFALLVRIWDLTPIEINLTMGVGWFCKRLHKLCNHFQRKGCYKLARAKVGYVRWLLNLPLTSHRQSNVQENACFELQLACSVLHPPSVGCTRQVWAAQPGPPLNFNDILIRGGGNRF